MMARNALIYRLLWLALLLLGAGPAHADPTFPKLTGRIVDSAKILPPDRKAAIEAKLAQLEATTRQQLVVATIPNLEGYDIADYGYRLGRAWGIGTKERNDGALLIVAPNERRIRIEAGYGLEPVLTDAMSSVIINSIIRPRFKAGDLPGGIEAGVDAIIQQIQLPPEEARARAAEAAQAQAQRQREGQGGFPASLIFWGFIFFFVIVPLLRGFGGRRRRHRTGIGDVILWTAINAAANSGDHDDGWGGGFSGGGWGDGGGFSGGGGSFGGGGASGDW